MVASGVLVLELVAVQVLLSRLLHETVAELQDPSQGTQILTSSVGGLKQGIE